jgi:hypothetical protein
MKLSDAIKTYFIHLMSTVTLLVVLVFGYKFYTMSQKLENERVLLEQRYDKLIGTEDKYIQLSKQVAQLSTVYQTQKYLKVQLDKFWKEVKLNKKEVVNSTETTVVTVTNNKTKQNKSDYTFISPDGKSDFVLNELHIAGKDSPVVGYILVKKTGQVEKDNYKFQIKLDSVQIKDEKTGKIRVVSKAYILPLENGLADTQPGLKKWANQEYPLSVTGGEIIVDPKEEVITTNPPENYLKDALLIGSGVLGFMIFKNPALLKFW